jgi:nucleotide-binding universal stress UspA family protein
MALAADGGLAKDESWAGVTPGDPFSRGERDGSIARVEVRDVKPSSIAPIVVGVDGSVSSLSAVAAGAGQAVLYGCPLFIVHSFNWLPRRPEDIDPHPANTANDLIQRAVTVAGKVSPHLAITTRLLEGAATATLLRQARSAALLAIGDGGLSAHVCLPTHTSAVHIAARAPCTVLIARATPPSAGPIVVGVNGSPASERTLDFAFDLTARRGESLVVVRAGTATTGADTTDVDQVRDLADLVAPRENKYHVTAHIRVPHGDPAAELVAESQRAGLVIVGARGRQPYGGLLGSVAQTLLHHCPAPLILVRGLMPPRFEQSDRRSGR